MLDSLTERSSGLSKIILPLLVIGLVGLPVLIAVSVGLVAGEGASWDHILQNRLWPYTFSTLAVLLVVAFLIVMIAVPAAWLVSVFNFPGRRFFTWALILPLAMPGYVMAYAWADLMGVAGPLQTSLREMTGWSARDYWFPDLFTHLGLGFVLASTLFPYVYITARAAFVSQSLTTLEAARSLGAGRFELFWKVALPAARPAILGGLSLALMEAAADYGAADFMGIQTLGVGIVRAWSSFGEPATAARLALMLILIAAAFLIAARYLQGQRGSQQTSSKWSTPRRVSLNRSESITAIAICASILVFGFLAPVGRLIWLTLETEFDFAAIGSAFRSSVFLGLMGTIAAFLSGLVFTLWARNTPRLSTATRLVSAAGYATPGVVLGLAALVLLKASGQPLSGAIALSLLVWIYVTRFTSAGIEPLQAALLRAPKSLDMAALSLGSRGLDRFWRVDLPILAPGAFAAGLILFVEMIKELPATLMLRPFGWDTLAVKAHAYATDERLAQATLPSLLIVLAGLGPVLLLSWRLSRSERT